ncbi:hypothetical protein GBAR_LOCUS15321, partial [Geodia barretti]
RVRAQIIGDCAVVGTSSPFRTDRQDIGVGGGTAVNDSLRNCVI